jgi:hypothetical protein
MSGNPRAKMQALGIQNVMWEVSVMSQGQVEPSSSRKKKKKKNLVK